MKKGRIISLMAATVVAVAFVACSGNNTDKTTAFIDHLAIYPDRTGTHGGNRTFLLASLDGDVVNPKNSREKRFDAEMFAS